MSALPEAAAIPSDISILSRGARTKRIKTMLHIRMPMYQGGAYAHHVRTLFPLYSGTFSDENLHVT